MTAVATRLERAMDRHQTGDLKQAEALYRGVLQRDAQQADALNLLGVLCGQTGRADQAMHFLRRAVEARPDAPAIHQNLATVLRAAGRLEEAVTAYQAAIAIDPGYVSANLDLGITLLDLGRDVEAIDALTRAVARDPSRLDVRRRLAELLDARGEVAEAAQHWQAALKLEPDRIDDRMNLGIALHRLGRLDESIAQFRDVTQRAPELAAAWANLGAALRTAGRLDEAESSLEQAINLDPSMVAPYTSLASVCLDQKRSNQAMAVCRDALDRFPEDARVHRTAASALVQVGEHAMAEDHVRIAIQQSPREPATHGQLGDVLRRMGRLDEADAAHGEALRLDPDAADAIAARIELALQRDERAGALAQGEAALRRFPDDVTVAFAAAAAYQTNQRYDDAAATLERFIERTDVTPGQRRILLFQLGDAHHNRGDHDHAWRIYEQANGLKASEFDHATFERQVDEIKLGFMRESLATAPRAAAGTVRPILIAGMPRSGTTLIEQILDSHPDVTGGGEMGLMGRTIGRIEPLTGVTEAYPQCAARLDEAGLQRLADFANREFENAAQGSAIITEKTPTNMMYLGLAERLFPEAIVIWCLRDPIDTCLSCYFHDFTGAHPYAYDIADLGFYARMHDCLLDHWRDASGLPLMTVRYESVVDDLEGQTRRLLEFCGLPWNDACLRFHENERIVQTASLEQVREPIYRSSVGRHRQYEQYLGPLREALGMTGEGEA